MSVRNTEEAEWLFKHFAKHPPRYDLEAYFFVLDALHFTLKQLKPLRHLEARELLEGLRHFGLKSFGPMSRSVLEHWGIFSCEDFGNIVFDLVHLGFIGKKEDDSISDFKEGFSFKEAFDLPYHR